MRMRILFFSEIEIQKKQCHFEQDGFRLMNRAEVNRIANDKLEDI